jgi:glycosyltransferase involved in cell wall biosynthesis
MKIVHVIGGLSADGAENVLVHLCRALDGYSHHVVSLTTLGPAAEGLKSAGIPVEALGLHNAFQVPGTILALRSRLRQLRPDIVQTWMYHSDLIGGLAAKLAGVPKIAWAIHHSDLDRRDSKRLTLAIARACAWLSPYVPNAIVTCSATAKDVHTRFGYRSQTFPVIPNGFDLGQFRPDPAARAATRRSLGLNDDEFVVGMCGRFTPQKGHRTFLEAVKLVTPGSRKLKFLMAGRGIDAGNESLREWIDEGRLGPVVSLLGERRDMPALLASLDLLVLSSIHGEAFPLIVGEAMACGIPCVVTRVGDSAYIVGDTAPVVQPRDARALADAMERLIRTSRDEREQIGRRARQRVLENVSIGAIEARYRAFYDELFAAA